MRNWIWELLVGCIAVVVCGCGSSAHPQEIVGKWRLVRADGKPPAEWWIKSHEIDLAADGTWTCKVVGEGYLDGMTVNGGGTWSLADGVMSYTNGVNKGTAKVRLEAGHLTVDPGVFISIRKKSPGPIAAEYER